MKLGCIATAVVICLVASVRDLRSDVVWLKDREQPICGMITAIMQDAIEFRVADQKGEFTKNRTIKKADIEQTVRTIDVERLCQLGPDQPICYRELAEELSGCALDPVARSIAKRLFLIAAYHGDDSLRNGCLLALRELASSETERRKVDAILSLDSGITFQDDANPGKNEPQNKVIDQRALLRLVQQIRRGKFGLARNFADSADGRRLLESLSTERRSAVTKALTTGNVDNSLLSILISVEVELRKRTADEGGSTRANIGKADWSTLAFEQTLPIDPFPSLEKLLDFDPSQSIFDGKDWVHPTKSN